MRTGTRTVVHLRTVALLILLSSLAWALLGVAADLSNPHANLWRWVRHGIPGFTQVSSQGHTVLIQNGGENWRELRNGLLMRYAQWLPGLALAAMLLFWAVVGTDRLEEPRSGIRIERFTLVERVLHWYTAALFIGMAVTGFSLILGRLALIPVFGYPAVSGYLRGAKLLHNWGGPLLLLGIALEFVTWVRYNIPRKTDLAWFRNMGGMLGHGPAAPAGKVNGGEKAWFWGIVVFGIGVGVTGILLDFPVWGQSRLVMQVSHVIHVVVGVLFVTVSFGHIYVGTVGAEGAFEGMWGGTVDAVWARKHNRLWYEEMVRRMGITPPTADERPQGTAS